jgi:hypothetical protein
MMASSATTPGDPTRAELLAFLESVRRSEIGAGEPTHTEAEADAMGDGHECCPCRFDVEEAAYYLAAHWHGGQSSNLYSALSTSPFRPGPCDAELPDDPEDEDCERYASTLLYLAGDAWIGAGCPRHACPGTDDDDRPLEPLRADCGRCGAAWCDRCDPTPSALCHYCHGRGHSTAEIDGPTLEVPQ